MQVVMAATNGAIMAIIETDNTVKNARPVHVVPGSGIQELKQSTFDWKVTVKYQELCHFETKEKSIFMTKSYITQERESILIILNRLG